MKKEHIVILVAIGSGLAAMILVFNFLQAAQQVEAQFVITRAEIPQGQVIQEQDISLSRKMKRSDAKKFFLETEDVIGQAALKNISSGSLIYRSRITRQAAPGKKSLPIPQGMRALTISRHDIVNVPDLLEIGSYVDIIGLINRGGEKPEMSTIVVSRQVISVSPLDRSPIESITVAVMPSEAEVAIGAATLKPLQILVRQNQAEQRTFEAPTGTVEIIRGVNKEGAFKR